MSPRLSELYCGRIVALLDTSSLLVTSNSSHRTILSFARSFSSLSSVLSLFLPVVARPRAATKKRRTPPRVRVLDLVPRLSLLKKPIVLERKKERKKGRKKGRKEGTGRVYIVLYLEKERNRSNRFFLSLSFPFPLN